MELAENWIIADFLSTRIDLKAFLSARCPGRMAREERVRMCSRKWLIVALVACGLASACSDYNTNLSIQTSSSVLTFVSPSSATVGGQGFTITANGSGFVTGALILWNGTALTTTLVSSNQLTAPVPASDLATAGTVKVAVQIPGSAQSGSSNVNNTTTTEVSNIVLFTIGAAPGTPPAITSLSASTTSAASTPYCSSLGFTLTVTGTNFTSDSLVNWNGTAQPTTFVSATQLTATIAAAEAAFPGTTPVTVTNSIGTSTSLPFTLSTPTTALAPPTLGSLSQTSAAAGSPALTLTVTGTNILPCSVVQWVNASNVKSPLTTTYVSATQLSATVPATDFLSMGTAQVVVFTLGPGGGTSPTSISFTIMPPTVTSLSSSTTSLNTTPSCSPSGFTLTVNGTNFVNGSVVDWNNSPRATTFVSSTQLTATIPASDIASAGTASITVSNSGARSAPASFTISASSLPAPTITFISPVSATAGTAAFSLSVTGSNFLPCSSVQWNGSARLTSYVSATQLQALITVADVASVGTIPVTVSNPAPAGGVSSAISFSIVAPTITSLSASTTSSASTPYCSPSGLTLTVNGTNFVNGIVVNWNGSPRPTTFVSATQLTAAITAADTAFPGTAAITASNSTTTSNSSNFSMTTPTTNLPAPSISSLSPSSQAVQTAGSVLPLDVNGSNLLPCSVVNWTSGSSTIPFTTTFIATTGITATIPVDTLGTFQVTVVTPAPGGGTSTAAPFTVYTPVTPAARTAATAELANSSVGTAAGVLSLPLMSSDKRYAVLVLASLDGASEIPGTTQNIFVRDTCEGAPAGCTPSVALASIGLNSNPADGDSISPSISADGRYVAFLSSAMNLVDSDTNGVTDVFVRDTCAGAPSGCTPSTQRVSVATNGTQANGASTSATISATGRYITFESAATNLGLTSSSASGIFLRDTCVGASASCAPSTQPLD